MFIHYRPDPSRLVIELHDVIDLDEACAVEVWLTDLIARSRARTVIIDVHAPLVTATGVGVLLGVRRVARGRGVALGVVARQPLVRKVFRIAGVSRVLLVTTTLSGAVALTRGCGPAARGPTWRRRRVHA
ncbi:STAS domain-containing protein [Streptomyces sp. B6B3]|uniref:STAS domain-containing protein n=1 Tax=Streptomyces sp. B6B3 TaxID=3153570 RepID=UPI00325EE61F